VSTAYCSWNVTTFCNRILQTCPFLENVELNGITITKNYLAYITAQSLTALILKHPNRYFESSDGARLDPIRRGEFHLCVLKAVLKKNPRIRRLHLGIDFILSPFTFEDMEEISNSNRELRQVCKCSESLGEEEGTRLVRNSAAALDCPWFYVKSFRPNSFRDDSMVKIITIGHQTYTGHQEFIVDLNEFRMLTKQVVQDPSPRSQSREVGL